MASLSNINGLFDVHSTGAIQFNGNHGTTGQILKSNGNAAPTWVDASTVIGGPYLPLTGGTLTGATATATGISFTVGGALTGTSATFSGNVTSTDLLTVSGDGHLFLGATGETPKIDMMYVDSASGLGWDTRIFTGKTDDLPNGQAFPTSTSAGGYGTQYQANSDGAFFGIIPYPSAASTHYRPVINWGDDVADSPFSFQFNGVDKATVSSAGVITAPTFVGALTGNATTASSAAQVTINYNNNSNADYQMLWGSGNNVYGTAGVVVNALSNTVTATTFNGALTGNAYSASSLEQHGNNSNPNNLNTLPWGKTSNYASGGYWSNGPSGMSYGSVYNFGGYSGNSALALEIAGDITHNSTSSTKDLWFRMGNNLGFQNDWKKIWNSQNLPNPVQSSGVTSVATGTGLTGGTITSTGTLSIDSTVATLAGTQTFTGNKYFNNFFLEYNSKTLANFNDLNNTQFEVSMYNVYNLATASTGMLSTYGTLFEVNGQSGHDKTQFAFNGGNGYIQYRKSWYPNTAWTSFRQIWDSGNLPNPTQGGPYLPLTGGTVTGLTNFTKANGPVVQITKTGSAPGNNTTLLVENTYANHSWGVVQEIRGGSTTGTDRPALLFSSPLTSQTWTTGYYYTTDDFAITSNRGYRNGGWGTLSLRVTTAGDTIATTSMQAPIFYDSLATAYYLDLGAGGISLYANGSVQGEYFVGSNYTSAGYTVYKGYDNWNHFIAIRGYARPGQGKSDAAILGGHQTSFVEYAEAGSATTGWFFMGSQSSNYVQVGKITQSHSEFVGSVRSPIFYDTNTAYYGDFASTSILNALQFNYTQHGSANNIRMGNSTTMNAISSGTNNAAFGVEALGGCSTGSRNFAYGYAALFNLSSGGNNIAMGDATGYNITSGSNNLLFGQNAGRTGYQSPQSIAGITTGSNQIHMGNESHSTARIQISWTVNSDSRDKTDVTPIDVGLDFVKDLNPVTFRWDKRSDYEDRVPTGQNKLQELTLGFLAQEVEEVEKSYGYNVANKTNLVVDRDVDQDHFGITYEKMIPILTKAIQEQQVIIDDLKSRIENLEL